MFTTALNDEHNHILTSTFETGFQFCLSHTACHDLPIDSEINGRFSNNILNFPDKSKPNRLSCISKTTEGSDSKLTPPRSDRLTKKQKKHIKLPNKGPCSDNKGILMLSFICNPFQRVSLTQFESTPTLKSFKHSKHAVSEKMTTDTYEIA